jgi:L-ascorbate metabolism protein UlaG (beta-lactamase superfamily)
MSVRITWYAHACFRLEGAGMAIVTDPYTPANAGLEAVPEPADAVVMSSSLDESHSCAAMVPGSPHVLNALDAVGHPYDLGGVRVEAFAAMEGSDRPDDPKANALYRLELEGIAICHMGDVGTPLSEPQIEALRGRVDVLLALAAGGLTIPLPDLDAAIERIGPRIVIPMHYRSPTIRYPVASVDAFLERHAATEVVRHRGSTLELDRERLPDALTIHVLDALMDPTERREEIAPDPDSL